MLKLGTDLQTLLEEKINDAAQDFISEIDPDVYDGFEVEDFVPVDGTRSVTVEIKFDNEGGMIWSRAKMTNDGL